MKRGEIYWFNMEDFCKQGKFNTKVLLKKRPYLIISNDKWNEVSGLVTVVPISSKERYNSDSHVIFSSAERKISVIVTEHITTVDQSLIGDYMETVSESVMSQVDEAIQNHLGIKSTFSKELNDYFCSSTDILEMFSQMIDKILKKKFEEERKKLMAENVDNVALRLASTIEDLFDTNTQSSYDDIQQEVIDNIENIHTKEDDINTIDIVESQNIETDIKEVSDETSSKVLSKKTKKPKIKKLKLKRDKADKIIWTPELKRSFVENSKKFTTEDMCILYGYNSKGSYYSSLYAIKKSLEKNEEFTKKC